MLQLTGDMVCLIHALGEEQAVIVGHDWGAAVGRYCALLRPDMFRAVALLSVPYRRRSVRENEHLSSVIRSLPSSMQAPALLQSHGGGVGLTSDGGQLVMSCGDLPDPWISNNHKHAESYFAPLSRSAITRS